MTGVVDLNVRLHVWRTRLAEIEAEAEKIRRKITFAEEIIKEEIAPEEVQGKPTEEKLIRKSPVPSQSHKPKEITVHVRALFESSPGVEIHVVRIMDYLKAKGVQCEMPSVYAACSRLKSKGIIETIKPATFKLKKKNEENQHSELGS